MQERAGGRQQGRIKRRENDLKRKTKGGKLNGNRKIVTFCMVNVGRKQLQNLRCDFAILNKERRDEGLAKEFLCTDSFTDFCSLSDYHKSLKYLKETGAKSEIGSGCYYVKPTVFFLYCLSS